jgi:hypothetical protein
MSVHTLVPRSGSVMRCGIAVVEGRTRPVEVKIVGIKCKVDAGRKYLPSPLTQTSQSWVSAHLLVVHDSSSRFLQLLLSSRHPHVSQVFAKHLTLLWCK